MNSTRVGLSSTPRCQLFEASLDTRRGIDNFVIRAHPNIGTEFFGTEDSDEVGNVSRAQLLRTRQEIGALRVCRLITFFTQVSRTSTNICALQGI